MADKEMEDPRLDSDTIAAIEELVRKNPAQILAKPPGYERFNPESSGSWKQVLVDGSPAGVLWTDWENATGLIATELGEEITMLRNHITANKALNAPAGIAYTSTSALSNTMDNVSFGEQEEGLLAEVENVLEQITEGTDNDSE